MGSVSVRRLMSVNGRNNLGSRPCGAWRWDHPGCAPTWWPCARRFEASLLPSTRTIENSFQVTSQQRHSVVTKAQSRLAVAPWMCACMRCSIKGTRQCRLCRTAPGRGTARMCGPRHTQAGEASAQRTTQEGGKARDVTSALACDWLQLPRIFLLPAAVADVCCCACPRPCRACCSPRQRSCAPPTHWSACRRPAVVVVDPSCCLQAGTPGAPADLVKPTTAMKVCVFVCAANQCAIRSLGHVTAPVEIRSIADAIVSSGLQKVGFQYIELDDCWGARTRLCRVSIQHW